MISKTFTTTLVRDGAMCAIELPFDPKAVFGKVRAPVRVTLNGYTYRSTIASMGGPLFVPLRRSHREAAGLAGGETLSVCLELDAAPRTVTPPRDLVVALKASPPAWERWQRLSYTLQCEHVEAIEGAKRAETRQRRIAQAAHAIGRLPPKKSSANGRQPR